MSEHTSLPSPADDPALDQARALLAELRARAAAEAPALVEGLARLDALLASVIASDEADATIRTIRDESASYASLIAHEVRLPLTSVRGYADMLRQGISGPLTDMQMQFVNIIRDNALRMEELVNNINDLSKIRAGRLKLDRKMGMVRNVMQGVEKATRKLAEEKGHALVFETPDGLPYLDIDNARVTEAVAKLVTNALMYTPPGAGQITVRAERDDGALRVTITDNGIGMSEAELARLGEAFWRADADLVRQQKGHGLGFAVAKGVIELHGGAVHVESAPGAGTTVSFTLPVVPGQEDRDS